MSAKQPPIVNNVREVHYNEQDLVPSLEPSLIRSIHLLSEQGNASKNNEDTTYADPDQGIVGVFDGASDIVGYKTPEGLTGGAVASRIAADILSQARPDQSLPEIMMQANEQIDRVQRDASLDPADKAARFCTTGAIARIRVAETSKKVIDLAQIADSIAIVVFKDGRTEAPLGLYDQDEETLKLWQQMVTEGMTGAEIMADPRMQSQIRSKRSESNVTYGVLNGESDAARFIRSATIPADNVAKVILLTDGLFIPKSDPSASQDWAQYTQIEVNGGLKAILDHVRDIEAHDPDCTAFPRVKQHDDATGAVLEVNYP